MRFLAFALLLAFAFAAKADGIFTKNVIGIDGIYSGKSIGGASGIANGTGGGAPPPPLTNLRITDTGAFRIIGTGDNRAVFP